ncbi:hypothetical protein [Hymenobacter sp.]|uniref:hypothetical protein n=1 Tax=Hymenobacter sp. TaxID=1898978 RepID=UPI00286ABDC9|nr:hypothetical protein [Hymenobacter sp.]
MNIDRTPIPGFKAVAFFRQVKEELSREMAGKTFAERQALLRPYRTPNAPDQAAEPAPAADRT